MSPPRCDKCDISCLDVMLYRTAPKGQDTTWRCEKCLGKDLNPDPTIKDLGRIITEDNKI